MSALLEAAAAPIGVRLELSPRVDGHLDEPALGQLRRRTAEGAVASFALQASSLALRLVSMVILARMLAPEDFGLVGMVTAMTGFMALFKEAGLSNATVQSKTINDNQLSTLFWINMALGSGLSLLCLAGAPAVAAFYAEPRLSAITMVVGTSFVFTGLAAQHRAILLRDLRIRMLALIDIIALLATIVSALALAAAGFGYWALVANVVVVPIVSAIGAWLAAAWIPGRPRRGPGIRRMLTYGGTVTLNSLIVYLAYNIDKVLLGRYWGAEALGIYGRAYQLLNLPTDSLHTTIGTVAFPALSRLQGDPVRLRRYFLCIYSFFLAIALPITVVCAFFSEDVVLVLLGPKWRETAGIFRLLAPTILVFALINPLGWLMFATAQMKRSLKIATTIMVVCVSGYALGLRSGPSGVALGFSTAMVLLVIPFIVWARRDTLITSGDLFKALLRPLGSVLLGAVAAVALWPWLSAVEPPLVRLTLTSSVVFGVHAFVLLVAFGERHLYSKLLIEAGIFPGRK